MANARGQKRDLEKARMERAAMKRARRQTKGEGGGDDEAAEPTTGYSEADVLAALAELHRRHADEQISQDDFEASRDELMQRLRIN